MSRTIPANLKLVEEIVRFRPDLRLLAAGDGPLGLALARAHRPEIILMDLNLPGMSGLEVLAQLQREPRTSGHSGDRADRQRDATRYRARHRGRLLPLPHQADRHRQVQRSDRRHAGLRAGHQGSGT
jgi:CheY-like chemotaxis protein